jgi:Tol biopolymer transport system component
VLLVVTLVMCAPPPGAQATYPGANGRIAFTDGGAISTINPDGTGKVTLTAGPDDGKPAWSPDGQRIAFERRGVPDSLRWIFVMTGSGASQTQLTSGSVTDFAPTWSPDGQRIAFARDFGGDTSSCRAIFVMNADGTGQQQVLGMGAGPCIKDDLAWSPLGERIAFDDNDLFDSFENDGQTRTWTVRPDGTGVAQVPTPGPAAEPDWSPAGDRLVYSEPIRGGGTANRQIETIALDGSNLRYLHPPYGTWPELMPNWSPDGTAFVVAAGLATLDDAGGEWVRVTADGHDPSWQPLPPLAAQPGYPRPRGASPSDISLVPAYQSCEAPNHTHGAPLSFASCGPPQQTSQALTFGTPDANGLPAAGVGRVRFEVHSGNPATPGDEADVEVNATLSDVRCAVELTGYCEAGALSDYTGSLQLFSTVRITDKHSGGSSTDPATLQDWPQLSVEMPCSTTPQTGAGSNCTTQTSLDAVVPQLVAERRRSVWELGQVGVRDGGIDAQDVDAYTTLAVQGLFVP